MKDFLIAMLPWIFLPPLAIFIWAQVHRRRHPPTPEQLEAARALRDSRWLPSGWVAMVFMLVYEGTYYLRGRSFIAPTVKALLLILPVAALAWFFFVFIRERRAGGDLERAVQGEACARAIGMFLFWAMGMWLMDELWPSPHHGTFNAGLFLPLFYFVGMFGAKASLMPVKGANHANR